jgi:hypothetical protein
MFGRPVSAEAVLTVARHPAFGGRLDGRTPAMVETAARERLGGLVSWHPAGTVSAHPLVRDAFRSLALAAAGQDQPARGKAGGRWPRRRGRRRE